MTHDIGVSFCFCAIIQVTVITCMMFINIRKGDGFTLIELLVVISIIGLLATTATVSLTGARIKARDAKRLADMRQLQTALEFYASNSAGGLYPSGTDIVLGSSDYACLNSSGFQPIGCTESYMGRIQPDPGSNSYVYRQLSGGTSYRISFTLETDISGTLGAGEHFATPDGFQ